MEGYTAFKKNPLKGDYKITQLLGEHDLHRMIHLIAISI